MDKLKIRAGDKFKIIKGFRKNEIITVKHEALNNSPYDFKCKNGDDWFLSEVEPYIEQEFGNISFTKESKKLTRNDIKPGDKFKVNLKGSPAHDKILKVKKVLTSKYWDFHDENDISWKLSEVIPFKQTKTKKVKKDIEIDQHQGHPEIYKNLLEETLKFDEGKTCLSDIPQLSLMSVAKVFNYGSKKYSKFNYSGGTFWLRYYDACQRHLNSWMIGEDIDESTNHHLDHAIASLMMLRENIHLNKGTDDRNKTYKILK